MSIFPYRRFGTAVQETFCLALEYGTDKLCGNFDKQLPTYSEL